MNKLALFLLLSAAPGCARGGDAAAPATARAPSRICSVALSADEVLIELVGAERLAAVSAFVDDAALSNAAGMVPKNIPRVRAELERIVALAPDLVCVNPYNSADFLDLLQKSGLPYFRFGETTSFEGIERSILALGERVGARGRAEKLVKEMDRRLFEIARAVADVANKPRVYYWAAGWTAGKDTTIHEIIERAGCANAGAEAGRRGMYELSVEQLLALDPDILCLDARDSLAELPGRALPEPLKKLRAVREGRVVEVPGRALTALSHHAVEGVECLARKVHPSRFAASSSPNINNSEPYQK